MKWSIAYFLPFVSILFFACNTPRYMYSPSAQNVPVLVKKGDSKLSANYATDLTGSPFNGNTNEGDFNKSHGFDLQGAVAVTNNFAIQANYFNRTERSNSFEYNNGTTVVKYKRYLTEIGVGYFRSLSRRDKVMFQVFGGVGKGNFSFIDSGIDTGNASFTRNHSADVLKIYFQPVFIFRIRDNFALSVSTRYSVIGFNHIKTDYTQDQLEYFGLNQLANGTRTFWEPAFTNTFGFSKLPGVKFEYQFGFSTLVSDRPIDHRSFNFSAAIMLDIPKLLKGNQ